jgi:hypothetical protein
MSKDLVWPIRNAAEFCAISLFQLSGILAYDELLYYSGHSFGYASNVRSTGAWHFWYAFRRFGRTTLIPR